MPHTSLTIPETVPERKPYVPWKRPPPPRIPHPSYFEGVLQLRNPSPELIAFVKHQTRKDNKALITKGGQVPGGVDFYYSDQHYLQSIGKMIPRRFPGEIKVTSTLHTLSHLTSREVYRVTVMFRLSPFRPGDIVVFNEQTYSVVKVGSHVILKNLHSGEKERKKLSELIERGRPAQSNSE